MSVLGRGDELVMTTGRDMEIGNEEGIATTIAAPDEVAGDAVKDVVTMTIEDVEATTMDCSLLSFKMLVDVTDATEREERVDVMLDVVAEGDLLGLFIDFEEVEERAAAATTTTFGVLEDELGSGVNGGEAGAEGKDEGKVASTSDDDEATEGPPLDRLFVTLGLEDEGSATTITTLEVLELELDPELELELEPELELERDDEGEETEADVTTLRAADGEDITT